MSTVEERLAKVEREIELLREKQRKWPIAELDEQLKNDPILVEIFRLAVEDENSNSPKD